MGETTKLVVCQIFLVPLELHPQEGILFLAPAGGSNPARPYPYGVQTLLVSNNHYLNYLTLK